jgi:hypothetical protein
MKMIFGGLFFGVAPGLTSAAGERQTPARKSPSKGKEKLPGKCKIFCPGLGLGQAMMESSLDFTPNG